MSLHPLMNFELAVTDKGIAVAKLLHLDPDGKGPAVLELAMTAMQAMALANGFSEIAIRAAHAEMEQADMMRLPQKK